MIQPKTDFTAAIPLADIIDAMAELHPQDPRQPRARSTLAAASLVGYAAGKVNHLDYSIAVAECKDPDNFDFDVWYSTYEPPADIDEQGFKP